MLTLQATGLVPPESASIWPRHGRRVSGASGLLSRSRMARQDQPLVRSNHSVLWQPEGTMEFSVRTTYLLLAVLAACTPTGAPQVTAREDQSPVAGTFAGS